VVGREDAGDEAQEGGFAAAVAADLARRSLAEAAEAEDFPAFEVEGDVSQSPKLVLPQGGKTEVGGQRSESGGQRSEVRGPRSENCLLTSDI